MKPEEEKPQLRTPKQNNAVHLWFELIAEELNGAGFEQKITFGTVDTPWSKESIKLLFKKIGLAQFGKAHTSDMTTKELTAVSETLNRFLGERGTHVPFPSIDEMLIKSGIVEN